MTPTKPPSDEVMGKVLVIKECWTLSEDPVISRMPCLSAGGIFTHGAAGECVPDPRADTNTALELLWNLEIQLYPIHSISKGEGWLAIGKGCDQKEWLPINHIPFCTAACCLAAKILQTKGE